jgi:hypothetical protein
MDYAACVLKKEKIPIVKQSRFVGSDRYYRGKIIKTLLKEQSLSSQLLGKRVKHDFSRSDMSWFKKVITKMVKEEILIHEKGKILLKS